MMLPKVDPTTTKSWNSLKQHFQKMKNAHIKSLFEMDPKKVFKIFIKV